MAGVVVLRPVTRPNVDGAPWVVPTVPASYSIRIEGRTGMYTVSRDGHKVHVFLLLDGADVGDPSQGVFYVAATSGPTRRWLKQIATESPNAWTFPELRADGTQPARAIKQALKARHLNGGVLACLCRTAAGYQHDRGTEDFVTVDDLPN